MENVYDECKYLDRIAIMARENFDSHNSTGSTCSPHTLAMLALDWGWRAF